MRFGEFGPSWTYFVVFMVFYAVPCFAGGNQDYYPNGESIFDNAEGIFDGAEGTFDNAEGIFDGAEGIFGKAESIFDGAEGIFDYAEGIYDSAESIFDNAESIIQYAENIIFYNYGEAGYIDDMYATIIPASEYRTSIYFDDSHKINAAEIFGKIGVGTSAILVASVVIPALVPGGAPRTAIIATKIIRDAVIMGSLDAAFEGVLKYIATQNAETAYYSAIEGFANGYMWGAIISSFVIPFSEIKLLKTNTSTRTVQVENFSSSVGNTGTHRIEYNIRRNLRAYLRTLPKAEQQLYAKLKLRERIINGRQVLIRRDIDPNFLVSGETNLERMQYGLAPHVRIRKPDGSFDIDVVRLHHIKQENDGVLAELTQMEEGPVNKIIHGYKSKTEVDRIQFHHEMRAYWKKRAEDFLRK